jgi:hypothetical protein
VTPVLRIVIAVLFHVTVTVLIDITIVVVLSVIGLATILYINSSALSPRTLDILAIVTKTCAFRTTTTPSTMLRTTTVATEHG